ncbi:unnamed protein product [Vitrella brassicaformis CCMP3155]|uniref:Uncharacterized protein n=1 Tax=Vitrella brassicaformis (strain CCMP3155) TaxID=1169540 RepID=A0A0G4GUG8_VITBC|nr:unnamed protein product [Vitrella brassicaformis CCMP3155]|eukprot:CEM34486.1 unnamed protein product [Vitrella brassicaformis CCMP3155]
MSGCHLVSVSVLADAFTHADDAIGQGATPLAESFGGDKEVSKAFQRSLWLRAVIQVAQQWFQNNLGRPPTPAEIRFIIEYMNYRLKLPLEGRGTHSLRVCMSACVTCADFFQGSQAGLKLSMLTSVIQVFNKK